MPQLAPMSWCFMSMFIFFVLFSLCCFIWWGKKEPLKVASKSYKKKMMVWFW